MDAQEKQPENPQQENQNPQGQSEEGGENTITLQEAFENFHQRITHVEALLTETMKAFQLSGQAINRLESFTFSMVKVCLDRELVEFKQLLESQKELLGFDDLHDYWGVPKPETTEEPTKESDSAE